MNINEFILFVTVLLIAWIIGKWVLAANRRKKEAQRFDLLLPIGQERYLAVKEAVLKEVLGSGDVFIERHCKNGIDSIVFELASAAGVASNHFDEGLTGRLSVMSPQEFAKFQKLLSTLLVSILKLRNDCKKANGSLWNNARQLVKDIETATVTPEQGVKNIARDSNLIDLNQWTLNRFCQYDLNFFYGAMDEYGDIGLEPSQVNGRSIIDSKLELDRDVLNEAKFWLSVHGRPSSS